jgi:site-specific DNA-methyltransferase (adenine-specific)
MDDVAAAELDEQSGIRRPGERPAKRAGMGFDDGEKRRSGTSGEREVLDAGGASRFFPVFRYQAKAPTRERPKVDGVAHPTVKPLELMRWLVRLVTPVDGIVLDPFAGSGTTLEAAVLEGMRCIGIEQSADYLPLIAERMARAGLVVL